MKFLGIVLIMFGFSQCGSLKLEKKPPFEITSAMYQNWVGGMPGASGTNVEIYLNQKINIAFDSLFFKMKSAKIEVRESKEKTLLIAHFKTTNRAGRDLILNSDPKKELKNEIPKINKFPFELKENEAVISYKVEGKTNYFKIENIKKGKPLFYPSAPPRMKK